MSQLLPRQRSLDDIVQGCREEALRAYASEAGYCFELFRRALEEQVQAAWSAIEQQYRRMVLGWVAARAPELPEDETANLAREAMEKFWRTLSPRSPGICDHFGHVGALLKYLNQCAITAVFDQRRRAQRTARLRQRLLLVEASAPPQAGPEQIALERLVQVDQLRRVRAWAAQVTDPLERRILYLSYEDDLTPAEIAERYPDEFSDAQVVRRIKERVLKRARRALGDDPEDER